MKSLFSSSTTSSSSVAAEYPGVASNSRNACPSAPHNHNDYLIDLMINRNGENQEPEFNYGSMFGLMEGHSLRATPIAAVQPALSIPLNYEQIITKPRDISSSITSSTTQPPLVDCNLVSGSTYDEAYNSYKWTIPTHFNIGVDVCDKHLKDKRDQSAIVYEDEHGNIKNCTFGQLHQQSNILANALKDYDIQQGDRVGVLLSQGIETALSHVTAFRMGAISIPLFTLFGPEGLLFRLSNSEASCVLTDYQNLPKILSIKQHLSKHLKKIVVFGPPPSIPIEHDDLVVEWKDINTKHSDKFEPVNTKADDPALIIFTSGTTGNPKGCLHAHRVLLGHLPGVQFPQNLFPQRDKKLMFYTPADWAWIGGLIDVLLPSLFYGVTVLAHRAVKFDAVKIGDLMLRHGVTTCFLPPTALKMMRQTAAMPHVQMVSVGSGGESLGDQLLAWGRSTFNVTINEFYGQTEANLLVGNCSVLMPVKNGSMGRPIPGHKVAIIDETGKPVPTGTVGNIAVLTPDPVVATTKPSPQLKSEIQEFVKKNLAAYEYPRLIEFVEALPMTTTGKIIRKDLRLLHQQSLVN
eukprot:gene19470-23318_t